MAKPKQIDITDTDKCPACGNPDLTLWAEDGESDDVDFWECSRCKAGGAVVEA